MFKRNLVARGLVGCLVVAAASAPAAAFANDGPDVQGNPGVRAAVVTAAAPSAGAPSGFAWSDAGIGAGATVVLLGAGAAVSGSARRRRVHQPVIG